MEASSVARIRFLKRFLPLLAALVLVLAVLTWGRSLSRAKPDDPPAATGIVLYDASLSRL